MFEVTNLFIYRFEMLEIDEHLRRIFDLVLSSTLFDTFNIILDLLDDKTTAEIKIEVLRCMGLISVGLRLFSQSEISIAVETDG